MEIRLKNVRIAFPALDKPEAFGEGEPAYQAKFIIVPDSAEVKLIDDALKAVAKEQWKDKAGSVLDLLKEDKKLCFVKAPYRNKKTGEAYAGFEGMFSLSTRSKNRPTVFDKFNREVTDPRDIKSLIYSGAFVHAKVDIWAQDNKWGRRINANIGGVMFAKDGEAFGGSAAASANDFADLKSDEDEEALV
jgi:hypothetical protein